MTDEAREPVENEEVSSEEEEGEAEEQEEEQEASELHPADRLQDVIREVLNQEKRLANKNVHNLKFELLNNVYPLLRTAFAAVLDFIDAMEAEREEGELQEQVQQEIRKSAAIAVENCKKLVKIHEEFGEPIKDILSDELKPEYDEVVEWSRKLVEQSSQVQ